MHRVEVPFTTLGTCFASDPLPVQVASCEAARDDGSDCVVSLFVDVDEETDCCAPQDDVDDGTESCQPPDIRHMDEAMNGAYDFDVFMVGECGQDAYTVAELGCRFLATDEEP